MPADYKIVPRHALVLSYAWGELGDEDLRRHYAALATDPAFDGAYRQLGDLREVTCASVSATTVAEVARSDPFQPSSLRALVAPNPAVFGVARMYASYAEAEDKPLRVFREMAAAEEWLALPPGTGDRLRPEL